MTIKEFIAQEGLIIIGIIVLLIVGGILAGREASIKNEYMRTASTADLCENIIDIKPPQDIVDIVFYCHVSVAYPTIMPSETINIVLGRDFPGMVRKELSQYNISNPIQKYYDENGQEINFINYHKAVFVILLIYPAYWLGRFIWWAIQTLRASR